MEGRRHVTRPFTVGVVVAAVIAVTAVLGVSMPALSAQPAHTLTIRFPTADGLLEGSDVLESGARVGTVSAIAPQPDDTALVTVTIDDAAAWPVHQGLSAAVRPKSLLGEKYVALTDGPGTAVAYNPAQTLVEDQRAVPVELDQFIDSLDPQTRLAAHTLVDDLGAGVAGRGADLNTAIAAARADLDHLAVTGQTLNNRDPELDRILVSLDSLLQTLTTTDQLNQFQGLINNGKATLNAVEAERQSFERSFIDADAALTAINTSFDSAAPRLRQVLDAAPDMFNQLSSFSSVLATMAGGVNKGGYLAPLISGVTHGPTSTGGAVEILPSGVRLPIFRICLADPKQDSCTGQAATASQPAPSNSDSTAEMAMFTAWLAS